jgi:FdrA protein
LAPAIAKAIATAQQAGRALEVVALVVGTDEDPQGLEQQVAQFKAAGAQVELTNESAVRYAGQQIQALAGATNLTPVDLAVLQEPLVALNVGLESFTASLTSQGAAVLQVDWKPPAGGNERMAAILARMKKA